MITRRTLLVSAAGCCTHSAAAPSPVMDKVDVFRAGDGGYAAYRIPGIVVTAKGTLIAYAEARKKSFRDWGAIDIAVRRSTDGGHSWSKTAFPGRLDGPMQQNPVNVREKIAEPGDITYNNAVAIAGRDATVHMVYCVEYMRAFYIRSSDDGVTWSRPVEITGAFDAFRKAIDWKVLAAGPGHGIQTRRGRLIVPVWLSLGEGSNAHGGGTSSSTIYSDDGGKSWRAGDIAFPQAPGEQQGGEPIVVELPNGSVMLNARNSGTANRRLVSISKDGAHQWSKPYFDKALIEPGCMGSLARHPKGILFSNPYNLEKSDGPAEPGSRRDRKNVSVQLSTDGGKTWPVRRAIEPGWSGYSDLGVGNNGKIYCFYEHGESPAKRFRPVALKVARFDLAWLTAPTDTPGV
ncbi:MAG: exo-alpha-sialidase [Bryobacterales bacterium]|nr:exo-alpha-sialidase [Bryobacterales bacterium]